MVTTEQTSYYTAITCKSLAFTLIFWSFWVTLILLVDFRSRIQSLAAADNISVEKSYSSCLKCSTSFNDSKNFILSIKPRRIRKKKKKNKSTTNLEGKSRDKPELKFKRNFNKKQQRLVYNVAVSLNCVAQLESMTFTSDLIYRKSLANCAIRTVSPTFDLTARTNWNQCPLILQ